ncbi:MAG TPA: FAD-dependent monooxygenase [Gaiellaceae bacterium]|nr:FAD-dependent monooxygenase [Gaiellaceae bacterium]
MTPEHRDVPVLIVGGSLVGLTTALLLRSHGIDALAVERHAGTAIHPRAGHFHLRTLEIVRAVGLEEKVRKRAVELYDPNGGINNVESLAGTEISHFIQNLNEGVEQFSPTVRCFIDQDAIEPIIRERALELGAEIRNRTELVSFEQDADGVTATIRDLESGGESTVRAQYMVAADGNRSPVRNRLGIEMRGHGYLSNSITIYFRADCAPLLEGRNQGVTYVTNPVLRGFFRLNRSGGSGFLVVNLIGDIARPEIVAQYPDAPWANVAEVVTPARAEELLRAAIGVPDFPVEVVDVATWRAQADSAERYRDGRVFLAGDAAHTVPPNGGYGGNTGIGDAWNLAWKLAAVLKGEAGPALLDTYDAERRPIGELIVEQAYTRYVTRVAPYLGSEGVQPIVDDFSMELGDRVHSSAVIDEPGDDGSVHEHPSEAGGRPGSRGPHVWLERDGRRISMLDLYGRGWVLLATNDEWTAPAGVERHVVPADVADAYGLGASGASLVRPDGIVAWRARERVGEDVGAVHARLLSR